MKVSELIEKLKDLPQDAEVKILGEDIEYSDFYTKINYFKMDEDHIHFYKQTNIVELGGQL
jgi:hypothetical protein